MVKYKNNDDPKLESFNACSWAVCYEIPANTQDDKKTKEVVTAIFAYPFLAEEFIIKVLPDSERFYIRRL